MITKLLENPLTSATTLNLICIKKFGLCYLNWEPEVVRMELPGIPETNLDKIQAISTILTTELYYTDSEAFRTITNTLNMNDPNFNVVTIPDMFDMTWSLVEAKLNDDTFGPIQYEVKAYIKLICKKDNIERIPPILDGMGLEVEGTTEISESQIDYEKELTEFVNGRLKKIRSELESIQV